MMRRLAGMVLVLAMLAALVLSGVSVMAAEAPLVILYTGDVHCGVDAGEDSMGYANLAALKKELQTQFDHVALVDAGDAIQGEAIGTLTDGRDLVAIMDQVGYDIGVFGNHEFDYGMDRALALLDEAGMDYLACNFIDLHTGKPVTDGYRIVSYGELDVAYVGIATPETFTKSTPTYFQDENGNYIYSFCEKNNGQELYAAVQSAVDSAIGEGADVVIAVGHLGTDPASAPWRSVDVIANTTGIDAFIDGHSHSVIAGETVENKDGNPVTLTATGTKMSHIGKMTVAADGTVTTELVENYTAIDEETDAFVKEIQAQFSDKLNEVVARSEVKLVVNDPVTGERIIRNRETNLGDLCADAYRIVLGADIGMTNGGGIRAEIAPGDVTYGDIIAVHPYGNTMCVVEAKGWEILDLLEVAAMAAPEELGSFMHVSGLKYTIDTTVDSTVELDDYGMLVSTGHNARVKNVQVLQKDGTYAPMDPQATYTLASHNYMIKEGGCSVAHFMDNKLLQDEVMIDNQLLITYIRDHLNGVIGEEYADPYGDGRITIVTEPIPETGDPFVAPLILAVSLVALLCLLKRRKCV